MPKAVHIICSESGSEDKSSGQVSLFNIIDRVGIRALPKLPERGLVVVQSLPLRISAAWSQEDGDAGQIFEFEMAAYLPPNDLRIGLAKGTFEFSRRIQRITVKAGRALPFQGAGEMRLENTIRRMGTETWYAQFCPVLIEMINDPINTPLFTASSDDRPDRS